MSKPKIVVIGSSNTDMTIKLDRLPGPGETVLGGEFFTAAGGKGANQAIAAVRAGGEVTFVTRVGDDAFGRQAVAGLKAARVDVRYLVLDEQAPSGVALIFIAADGENSIAVASGANARLSPANIDAAREALAGASVLLMQLEVPLDTVLHAAQLAATAKVPVILDPAPAQTLPPELLAAVAILTPNEHEAELLTGIPVCDEPSAAAAAERLMEQGVAKVVITLGPRGAFVATADLRALVPGFAVEAIDTVAAGDVFNGGLAVAIGEGKPLLDAVRFANAAAALSVTRMGAQASAPMRNEIDAQHGGSRF